MRTDEISLTLPADEAFHRIAHLVLGGLAVRLDLTYEHLEDVELALDTLLERCAGGEVTVRVTVADGELRTAVGPFAGERIRAELEGPSPDASLDLRRILEAVSDDVTVENRDDGDWVELTKRVEHGL